MFKLSSLKIKPRNPRKITKRTEVPDNWVRSCADLSQEQKDRFLLVDNAPDGMAGLYNVNKENNCNKTRQLVEK